ncbi:hypothetical protein AgCh_011448 [Apium graveolens]
MEINLIEREDSEIAWYVEGHQAWRDVGEDADEAEGEVVESAGTDEDQYVVNLADLGMIGNHEKYYADNFRDQLECTAAAKGGHFWLV